MCELGYETRWINWPLDEQSTIFSPFREWGQKQSYYKCRLVSLEVWLFCFSLFLFEIYFDKLLSILTLGVMLLILFWPTCAMERRMGERRAQVQHRRRNIEDACCLVLPPFWINGGLTKARDRAVLLSNLQNIIIQFFLLRLHEGYPSHSGYCDGVSRILWHCIGFFQ
jgi:hypothetical protein